MDPVLLAGLAALATVAGGIAAILGVRRSRRERRNQPTPEMALHEQVETIIRRRDPGFSADGFLRDARWIAEQVDAARRDGRWGPIHRYLTEGLFAAVRLAAPRRETTPASHLVVALAEARYDQAVDILHVRVGRATGPPPADAAPAGIVEAAPSTGAEELWTFVRASNASSRRGFAIEGRCPACDAELPSAELFQCPACSLPLNGGTAGWTVVGITPAAAWKVSPTKDAVPGLARILQEDRWLSVAQLEDRATCLLVRWFEAQGARTIAPLVRFALPPLVAKLQASFSVDLGRGLETVAAAGAVGPARLVGVDAGRRDEDDLAYVEVAWAPQGGATGAAERGRFQVVMSRGPAAGSLPGVLGDVCDRCGLLLGPSEQTGCERCGIPIEPGRLDWALAAVEPPGTPIPWRHGDPAATASALVADARRMARHKLAVQERLNKFAGMRR
jgi:hypothetical protein